MLTWYQMEEVMARSVVLQSNAHSCTLYAVYVHTAFPMAWQAKAAAH